MENEKYIKISELNEYIKVMFDENTFFHRIYLKGEISNFKNHTRGHLYFTLKDEESRISAVMFFNNARLLNFIPEDGMNVLVSGRISSYPAQGTYQIYVETMEKDGLGNLFVEYEKLKKKLELEGLFSQEHKKIIPKYPRKIGVITAPTGAAIRDILSTIKRRYPIAEVILFPSLVQGASAAPEIVSQIKKANTYDLDVLICGRGGGSIEDLWAFNEESVARAIFASTVPIISAVGHEVDFTIADFVADLRAPTPTGAAEMAVPTTLDLINLIDEKKLRLNALLSHTLKIKNQQLEHLKNSFVLKNPMVLYELKEQKLDRLLEQLNKSIKTQINKAETKFEAIKNNYILKNPLKMYEKYQNDLRKNEMCLKNSIQMILENKKHQQEMMINTLKLVNPLNILEKGYSVTTKNGEIIKDASKLKGNETIDIQFRKGRIKAVVKEGSYE
ncbi:MAG: exodeoxyribonuclease VII large subunit [Bacilli bacterium]|nr:exodeoxyribonuclease VII large subunit [Bacilli bacterium]